MGKILLSGSLPPLALYVETVDQEQQQLSSSA
jgi:hypothetical protein